MNNQLDKNFGDILEAMVRDKKAQQKKAKQEIIDRNKKLVEDRKKLLGPLLTALEQTKERYPKAIITGLGCQVSPTFYTGPNTCIIVQCIFKYDHQYVELLEDSDGDMSLLARSESAGELIPCLLEKLAACVERYNA